MWMALAFLKSLPSELIEGGAVIVDSSGREILPRSLVTALYRAFMVPVAAANPRDITVGLILEVVTGQEDWNEDSI